MGPLNIEINYTLPSSLIIRAMGPLRNLVRLTAGILSIHLFTYCSPNKTDCAVIFKWTDIETNLTLIYSKG